MDEQQKRMAEELLFSEKRRRSFGQNLYFGIFDSTKMFPYSKGRAEEETQLKKFLDQVRHFAETTIDPQWIDKHAEIPQTVISGLAKLGVLGMTVPQEYGGLGMSQSAYCQTTEILSGRCGSTALFVNAHQSIGLKALLLFGTPQQKERWLGPLARGEQLAAFSLTEPNAGSDAAGIETRAVFDPKKNVYCITGKKQWTTNGSMAHILTVMAKTEMDTPKGKQDKVTAFLVTPDMPGFKVTAPSLEKVGMRGSKTANLEFIEMEVPADQVLGPVGGGLKVCLTVLDYGRTTFGAACTGAAKFAIKKAIDHAQHRYQFNRPLASFGLVKKKIARMAALVYAMEAATYQTAGLVDAGDHNIMLESAMLKVFASESLWNILYDTMQIYGGRSFFTDYPFERMMRDARLNMIGEGSNEVMRAFIGAVGMRDVGMELQSFLEAWKHPFEQWHTVRDSLQRGLSALRLPKIEIGSPLLKKEAAQLARDIRRFHWAVIRLLKHYREEIVESQLELERIADSAIAIYTSSSALSRLDASLANEAVPPSQEIAAGKLYCRMAHQMVKRNLDFLFSEDDPAVAHLSDQLTGIYGETR